LPTAEIKTDPHFGKTEIYHSTLNASIPFDPTHPPKKISLTYQGCSQKGLCYAPISKEFKFDSIQTKTLNATSSNSEVDTMQFFIAVTTYWSYLVRVFYCRAFAFFNALCSSHDSYFIKYYFCFT
jgi:thiol:disulfide interchange protein